MRTTQLLHELTATGTAVIMATHDSMLPHQFPGMAYRCCDGTLVRIDATDTTDDDDADDIPEATAATEE